MPKAARLGDLGSGHGCFPPSPAIEGSSDIIINGKPAVRVGDAYIAHGCNSCIPHPRNAAQGSSTVNFNGKPAVRVGDGINCGGKAQTGSGNVFIGDQSWNGTISEPFKSKLQLYVTQTPGSNNHPYTFEHYKLYKDGGVVQEGLTNEDGLIEYEFEPPWTSELKVETDIGDFTYKPTALIPPENEDGIKQRLDLLGFYEEPELGDATIEGGTQRYEQFQSIFGEEITANFDEELIKRMKPIMP